MKRLLYVVLIIALTALVFAGGWILGSRTVEQPQQPASPDTTESSETTSPTDEEADTTYVSKKGVTLEVTKPLRNSVVTSPATITGSVPGNWSFEASFPIKILNSERVVIAETPAHLEGDWMTEELTAFSASVSFTKPQTSTGYLVLEKDNPSGLPENDDRLEIPIRF